MRPECIGRLLERFPFPEWEARPPKERYASWPEQARLLCAGKTEALRALQHTLIAALGRPVEHGLAAEPSAGSKRDESGFAFGPYRDSWLPAGLAALFLLTALAAWWLASRSSVCQCDRSVITQVEYVDGSAWATADLSSDLIFDFGLSEPRSAAHRDKLLADLRNLFREFHGITILAVTAHTDPIGGTEDNRLLGQRRADTIRQLIGKTMEAEERPGQFASKRLPSDEPSGSPRREDSAFWQACFSQYYLDVPARNQPLVDLAKTKNIDDRVPCSRASVSDIYPACARPPIPAPGQPLPPGYAQRAENLRELTACLAPMRHVLIQFSYARLVPKVDASTVTPVTGATK